MLFKNHKEKNKCYECAFKIDWVSWFSEQIRNRKDLTIQEKQNLIKNIVPSASPNWTEVMCTEYGHWMKNWGKENKICKQFFQATGNLDYRQMRYLQDRRLKREQMKVQSRTSWAMVFLTFALLVTAVVQIFWRCNPNFFMTFMLGVLIIFLGLAILGVKLRQWVENH